jgi:hypothetical protein
MLDLTKIDADTLLARGEYSTIRAAHEDEKKALQLLCGALASTATKILRRMQPDNDAVPESVDELLAAARAGLDLIDATVTRIASLAQQRAEVKPRAWGR